MTELPISPLARRIAEENNVDWRALEGSDAGGGVNERDVLNYLEGVMLGTKPVDPTPEPLPEGMTSWAAPGYLEREAQSPWTARATFNATADNAASTDPAATQADEHPAEDFEAGYRELFTELGALKTAAAASEEERGREREAAEQLQSELGRVQKTLTGRETELAEMRARLTHLETDLKTREQGAREAQLELTRLHKTLERKDEELVQVHALKEQVETLKAQLSSSEAQTQELRKLTERLGQAEAAAQKAHAEAEGLRAANTGLERTVTELRAELKAVKLKTDEPRVVEPEKRPWWKLWG